MGGRGNEKGKALKMSFFQSLGLLGVFVQITIYEKAHDQIQKTFSNFRSEREY